MRQGAAESSPPKDDGQDVEAEFQRDTPADERMRHSRSRVSLHRQAKNMIDRLNLDYRQLFLYTMRHHREMIHGSTRIELKEKRREAEDIKMPNKIDKLA